ncbi:hypothetical protein [Neobacillus dielmonensis]|uniref:hypothetical protein n=1 Tax=Neobacillus dielmonensis TaxID=1347369 RepID=UPI0005A972B3|nr:hypothetical protein [Neobacillus dielmonensis]
MFHSLVLSLFLYFPEDKSEYVPAVISLIIFMAGALVAMRIIVKISKRDEQKAKQLEEQLKKSQTEQKNS